MDLRAREGVHGKGVMKDMIRRSGMGNCHARVGKNAEKGVEECRRRCHQVFVTTLVYVCMLVCLYVCCLCVCMFVSRRAMCEYAGHANRLNMYADVDVEHGSTE